MKSSPILSSLGFTNSVFASLGAQREAPQWLSERQPSTHLDHDDVVSELFAERVQPHERMKYKLTAAIAELHYELLEGGAQRIAGVLYPSVAMWANGDNIALRPWFVNDHLEWKKAIHIRVDARDEKSFSISEIDAARHLDSDENLVWAGHAGVKLTSPSIFSFVFTAGRDEWGDYILGKDNVVGHWVGIEETTGRRFSV
jgi:hypothetical protein